jgi:hypothetical protein
VGLVRRHGNHPQNISSTTNEIQPCSLTLPRRPNSFLSHQTVEITVDIRVAAVAALAIGFFCANHVSATSLLAEGTWQGSGHHYVVYFYSYEEQHDVTWQEAADELGTLAPGYHLATITSQEENDFIWSLLEPLGLEVEWWLGGFQEPPSQLNPLLGWTWLTGEPWDYTNWEGREPNDSVVGNENHLAWFYTTPYWNDEGSCLSCVSGYIGERSTAVPVPATAWLMAGALGALGLTRKMVRVELA